MSNEPAIKASLVRALTNRVVELDREMKRADMALEIRVNALEETLCLFHGVYDRVEKLLKEAGGQ
jgi:hypothetical protein